MVLPKHLKELAKKMDLPKNRKISAKIIGARYYSNENNKIIDLKTNKRITKFKSRNLLGESRKIEERRLLKERVKEILKGSDRGVIREIKRGGRGYLAGTTKFQRRMRKKHLDSVGL